MEIIAAHKCLGCTVNDLEVENKIDFLCRPGAMRSLRVKRFLDQDKPGNSEKTLLSTTLVSMTSLAGVVFERRSHEF